MTVDSTEIPANRALVVPDEPPGESADPEATPREGFFDRAVTNLRELWRGIAGEADEAAEQRSLKEWRARIDDCLYGTGGEVSARARTAALGRDYLDMAPAERAAFLRLLAEDYGADNTKVDAAAKQCC